MSSNPVVLIDTNIIPIEKGFGSAFWKTVFQLCNAKNIRLALLEVNLHEAVNLKSASAAQWASELRKAHGNLTNIVDLPPIYIPDDDQLAKLWDVKLREHFEILPLHGDDAIEALRREALRILPARNGIGSRDSAIWLTAIRLIKSGTPVYLISENNKDFGKGGLHAELAAELVDYPDLLEYMTNLQVFIDNIAAKVSPPELTTDMAYDILAESIRAGVLDFWGDRGYEDVTVDDILDAHLTFHDLRTYGSSYVVDDVGLARFKGNFTLTISNGPVFDSGRFDTWLNFSPKSNLYSPSDVNEVTLDLD